ncbi:flagellar basal body P-ring formation chaperone FlgA [Methylotenera mobilis]|uniref:Flagella basal body P-ring formation protein FlgA n=1 Tax=Methylotenera mobilis (strain JLW8 / ATCC BAA-1282 / DSM 17540) TaxID=583345 RepID=C6WVB1_METML|nr:flagellar basal body P-ring formation chaperone FlgA [Methylotenera mobilis]ACT47860.1 flagella basal body P-ring formation protein FlgA [Methylotenera mobilis JLW8]
MPNVNYHLPLQLIAKNSLKVRMRNGLLSCFVMLIALMLGSAQTLHAATSQAALNKQYPKQDLSQLSAKVVEFLQTQTVGYPGKVTVQAGAIDPNLKLAQCQDAQVFLPTGSRAWGKTSVGIRCNTPSAWTIYAQATVNVVAQYLVAAVPLAQGRVVTADDLLFQSGDLTQLPAGIFTDLAQAQGRIVNISMTAGTVLRQEMLKVSPVVQQGQTVMVTSSGKGFRVSAEGKAMTKANEGQVVQVKVASGQVVSGIARQGGQVEVVF